MLGQRKPMPSSPVRPVPASVRGQRKCDTLRSTLAIKAIKATTTPSPSSLGLSPDKMEVCFATKGPGRGRPGRSLLYWWTLGALISPNLSLSILTFSPVSYSSSSCFQSCREPKTEERKKGTFVKAKKQMGWHGGRGLLLCLTHRVGVPFLCVSVQGAWVQFAEP